MKTEDKIVGHRGHPQAQVTQQSNTDQYDQYEFIAYLVVEKTQGGRTVPGIRK